MATGAFLIKRKIFAATPLQNAKHIVLNSRINNSLYFTKINYQTKKIIKIKANCGPHSFYEHQNLYYGVEKKGRHVAIVDFENPTNLRLIKCPDGILLYGHCAIYQDKLIVSAVDSEIFNTALDPTNTMLNNAPAILLIYNKNTLALIDKIEGLGYGPHDITFFNNQILVALYNDLNNRSTILSLDPETF